VVEARMVATHGYRPGARGHRSIGRRWPTAWAEAADVADSAWGGRRTRMRRPQHAWKTCGAQLVTCAMRRAQRADAHATCARQPAGDGYNTRWTAVPEACLKLLQESWLIPLLSPLPAVLTLWTTRMRRTFWQCRALQETLGRNGGGTWAGSSGMPVPAVLDIPERMPLPRRRTQMRVVPP
jgi:hypothetical protein